MTFYFYDLETSGISPKWQRIMQFGGVRTDADLNLIDEPYQTLVKLSDDVLPDPEAVMITGITPQQTVLDGISEAALAKQLSSEVFTKDTVALGYNSIRFDDEFIRTLFYRNYYDPYEREWSEGRGRWDIVDLARMTRALRPEGIKWPNTADGKPTNRLELLTKANNIEHSNAHDAMADVMATIELTRLIRSKQPKLYQHYFSLHDKKIAAKLIDPNTPQPIVHTSGRLKTEYFSTSVFMPLAKHPTNSNAILAWDLRYDPKQWQEFDLEKLKHLTFSHWKVLAKNDEQRLPVKAIHLNKSPAVAPLGVLDKAAQQRINLTTEQIEAHTRSLSDITAWPKTIRSVFDGEEFTKADDVDGQIYDGFISDSDKLMMKKVHAFNQEQLMNEKPKFSDARLNNLWLRYRARSYPNTLTDDERMTWEKFRADKFKTGPGNTLSDYMGRLQRIAADSTGDNDKRYLLEELQLWAESIMPFETGELF